MADDAKTPVGDGIVATKIEALRDDIKELKGLVKSIDSQQREAVIERVKICNQADAAHRRLDEFESRCMERRQEMENLRKQVDRIQKAMQPLITANKILVYVGIGLAGSVMGLIWGILTGQVQLVFL